MDEHATTEHSTCHIRVHGHLDPRWSAWFDGMTIAHEPNGTTCITGAVADQAALYGLLGKARDLGLALISVELAAPTRPIDRR
jgi:hypothetical protein